MIMNRDREITCLKKKIIWEGHEKVKVATSKDMRSYNLCKFKEANISLVLLRGNEEARFSSASFEDMLVI